MEALPYLLIYVIPLTTGVGIWLGGAGMFLGLGLVFILIPLLDALGGLDTANPDADNETALDRNPLFNLTVRLWFVPQVGLIAFGLWYAINGGWSPMEWIGGVLSVGVSSGAGGITVAHELMHRRGKIDRGLAELLMTTASYTHFCVEHVYGHHKHVATPEDPATARYGQSLYPFVVQSILGGVRSAWRLESGRVSRRKKHARTLHDRRLRYALDLALAYGLIAMLFGSAGVFFFLTQSLVAICLLELINYIEHYGLMRQKQDNGRYQNISPHHSWNSAHRLTRRVLVGLPRHADHHANASRPFWKLRHLAQAPQMPAGYAAMVLLSLLPPLWFKVMNPRVRFWQEQAAIR